MKALLLTFFLTMFSIGSIAAENSAASHERYEVCYLDGNVIMLQPNMCLALGGRRS